MPQRLKTGEPVEISTSDFFGAICPQILESQKEPCARLGGAYGIQLFGESGGAWTLVYVYAEVKNGIDKEVDLYLEMDAKDFLCMMKGTLNVENAARAGRIHFEGDPRLFNNLSAVLQPAEA